MSDFDNPWKEALDLFFERFIAFNFPSIHALIDWQRGWEPLEQELRQIVRESELGKQTVDKLCRVWLLDGSEQWVLIHIEIQSQYETGFPRRMYVYNFRIVDRYNRPVASLAMLAGDRPGWRPNRYTAELFGCRTEFEFPITKLLDWLPRVDELEASVNPFGLLTLAHLQTMQTRQDMDSRRIWKLRLFRRLLELGMDAETARQLFRLIDWIMDLPPEQERQCREQIQREVEEKKMPYLTGFERLAREEGLSKGRQEGLNEGRLRGLLPGIEYALELKFGMAGLSLMTAVRSIQDADRLETFHKAIRTAATLDDLRPLLPAESQAAPSQS